MDFLEKVKKIRVCGNDTDDRPLSETEENNFTVDKGMNLIQVPNNRLLCSCGGR